MVLFHLSYFRQSKMKKLLIASVILFVAGLGLILYSDPVISLASGNLAPNNSTGFQLVGNSTSGGGLPSGCHQSNGGVICDSQKTSAGTFSGPVLFTLIGIALSGAGILLAGIETVSKSQAPYQTKVVT